MKSISSGKTIHHCPEENSVKVGFIVLSDKRRLSHNIGSLIVFT